MFMKPHSVVNVENSIAARAYVIFGAFGTQYKGLLDVFHVCHSICATYAVTRLALLTIDKGSATVSISANLCPTSNLQQVR